MVSIVILVLLALALNLVIVIGMNLTGFSRVSGDVIDDTRALIAQTEGRLVPRFMRSGEVNAGGGVSENGSVGEVGRISIMKQTYDDSIVAIKGTTYWIDERTGIVAIDPSGRGGAVTSGRQISVRGVGFEYMDYGSFVLVPDDGVSSMVLIFSRGSIKSTLYMDNDARELLDDPDSRIDISGTSLMKVNKSNVRKAEGMELYVIETRNRKGGAELENAFGRELMSGSRVIYPQISSGGSEVMGSKVLVKEYRDIGFFEIRSISDFFLWLNLKFNMNLNNKEKKILQKGIFETLEETVEANSRYISGKQRI